MDQESKKIGWAILAFIILSLGFQVSEWVHDHMPWWTYRLLAGLLLGMVAAFSYTTCKRLIRMYRAGKLREIESNPWMCALTGFMYFFIVSLGLVVWFVGWEGHNAGWIYGLGVLVGGILVDAGLGPLVAYDRA